MLANMISIHKPHPKRDSGDVYHQVAAIPSEVLDVSKHEWRGALPPNMSKLLGKTSMDRKAKGPTGTSSPDEGVINPCLDSRIGWTQSHPATARRNYAHHARAAFRVIQTL
jgi:hypothetical protein